MLRPSITPLKKMYTRNYLFLPTIYWETPLRPYFMRPAYTQRLSTSERPQSRSPASLFSGSFILLLRRDPQFPTGLANRKCWFKSRERGQTAEKGECFSFSPSAPSAWPARSTSLNSCRAALGPHRGSSALWDCSGTWDPEPPPPSTISPASGVAQPLPTVAGPWVALLPPVRQLLRCLSAQCPVPNALCL